MTRISFWHRLHSKLLTRLNLLPARGQGSSDAIKMFSDEMTTKAEQKALEDSVANLIAKMEAVDHSLNELSKTTSEGFKKVKEGLYNLEVA